MNNAGAGEEVLGDGGVSGKIEKLNACNFSFTL